LIKKEVIGKVLEERIHVYTQNYELDSKIHKKLGRIIFIHLWGRTMHKFNRFVKLHSLTNHVAYRFCGELRTHIEQRKIIRERTYSWKRKIELITMNMKLGGCVSTSVILGHNKMDT
jgi:hypothetical protein